MIRKVLVGAGGWGETYFALLDQLDKWDELAAVVDPFVRQSSYWPRIAEGHIPVYETLDDFFANGTAELVIISSPSNLHAVQTVCALRHGAHVLCEKPLTETLQQAHALQRCAQAAGRHVGVAFPWSYTPTWQRIKANIQAGRYGRPLSLKTFASLPRDTAYYESSSWKGRIRDGEGRWVLDSVASNAASHYLHNLFFILGDRPDTARMPDSIEGSLYRAHPIESYDTCFLRGTFDDGCTFAFMASHASDGRMSPRLHIRFEQATLTMVSAESEIHIRFDDGEEEMHPVPGAGGEAAEKILQMERAMEGGMPPACHVGTVLPHLAVCNAMLDYMPIHTIPHQYLRYKQNPQGVEVSGLHEVMSQCFETDKLPHELGCPWAQETASVRMNTIHAFEGRLV